MTIINEDRELKENIRMMNSQRRDVEKKDLIEEGINPRVSNTSNGKTQWYYQNVQYVVVKNRDLLKIKKQKDY